jgi:hypothetical protein
LHALGLCLNEIRFHNACRTAFLTRACNRIPYESMLQSGLEEVKYSTEARRGPSKFVNSAPLSYLTSNSVAKGIDQSSSKQNQPKRYYTRRTTKAHRKRRTKWKLAANAVKSPSTLPRRRLQQSTYATAPNAGHSPPLATDSRLFSRTSPVAPPILVLSHLTAGLIPTGRLKGTFARIVARGCYMRLCIRMARLERWSV